VREEAGQYLWLLMRMLAVGFVLALVTAHLQFRLVQSSGQHVLIRLQPFALDSMNLMVHLLLGTARLRSFPVNSTRHLPVVALRPSLKQLVQMIRQFQRKRTRPQ
jgi:hypothetical protein